MYQDSGCWTRLSSTWHVQVAMTSHIVRSTKYLIHIWSMIELGEIRWDYKSTASWLSAFEIKCDSFQERVDAYSVRSTSIKKVSLCHEY